MDDKKYTLSSTSGLLLPTEDADKLIAMADGCSSLLYIYILRNSGELDPDGAARALMRSRREIDQAAERLRKSGLILAGDKRPRLAPDELPEYSTTDISRRSREDSGFSAVLEEAQRAMGRLLSGSELKTLLGMYDYLGLPAEVLLMMLNHCLEDFKARYGPGRLPTMRRLEKEAYAWANMEIFTLEQAEDYLRSLREKSELMSEIKRLLQIRDRDFSPTERRYVQSWIDMGFGAEAIELAYDKTVVKTGKLQWKYMNSIISSWHQKGLHTPDEIETGDGRPASKKPAPGKTNGGAQSPTREDFEEMQRLFDKVKNG